MASLRRLPALLGAFLVLSLALAACGDGVPDNAVVKIGSDSIKTSEFDHWLQAAFATAEQQRAVPGEARGKVVIPKPPEFTECIATKKKMAVKPAQGLSKPTDATYKAECQQEYTTKRGETQQFLITAAWIEGEAADRDVKVSDAEVKKRFDTERQRSFPKDKVYVAFLKASANTQENLLYRTKIAMLSEKLREKVLKGTDKVSDAQIANYYNKNKIRFAVPETRDVRIVLTKTEAQAKKAKSALDGGQSFKAVAAKYSIDQATKDSGGVRKGVPKGQQEKSLDTAEFTAPKNKIVGPVKTQFGYYVFQVTQITPRKQQPLSTESKASIKKLLINQQQQTTLDKFVKGFEKKWKDRTVCQKGYQTKAWPNMPPICRNTEPGRSTPAPSSTATPQKTSTGI
jgi:foldase protein PrsA